MRESDLVELRVLPKVFPRHPYARHTAGLGAGDSATPPAASNSSRVLNVKVIGIYCSRQPTGEPSAPSEKGGGGTNTKVEMQHREGEAVSANEILGERGGDGMGDSSKRHIYVRVQFNKALVDTMPLEVMREKYPQVLIDYLLSTAVWT
ncbi:hypothetical protein TraAM80_04239 [Trypanosoma rangeli]|uniref:Uncharacterized protein n=1 Tax=Trypanosoma rangeli TaxID=5698 RepID=A0A3S5IRD2_TRYRA|nr:uncharacterized protein TraAM80_04239 [Trypanosoma rangeli]RNF05993.1 hypothetical protein TraAM80_04239 [Trypanosoma rangeli]|eukprot:RNF05993.1 hypothetical protein TraAM80_04239 [Trypanosoma rangeli]